MKSKEISEKEKEELRWLIELHPEYAAELLAKKEKERILKVVKDDRDTSD